MNFTQLYRGGLGAKIKSNTSSSTEFGDIILSVCSFFPELNIIQRSTEPGRDDNMVVVTKEMAIQLKLAIDDFLSQEIK